MDPLQRLNFFLRGDNDVHEKFCTGLVVFLFIGVSLTTSTFGAEPKKADGRFGVGDLVEFTTGMGPMLGEVLNGPDPSNYYGILIPSRGEKPINGAKLRLIQRADAPNDSFKPGDAVKFRGDGNSIYSGNVVKVKGAWCQVEAPGVLGWVECKGLRTAKNGATSTPAASEESTASAAPKATAAAAAAISGTYQNAEGNTSIEFLPAGKAHLSLQGLGGPATNKVAGNKLTLMVGDDAAIEFTINPDNSLTGPPDGYLSRMKKKKE